MARHRVTVLSKGAPKPAASRAASDAAAKSTTRAQGATPSGAKRALHRARRSAMSPPAASMVIELARLV